MGIKHLASPGIALSRLQGNDIRLEGVRVRVVAAVRTSPNDTPRSDVFWSCVAEHRFRPDNQMAESLTGAGLEEWPAIL